MKRLRASSLIRTNAGSPGQSNTVLKGLDQQVVQPSANGISIIGVWTPRGPGSKSHSA